jgi:hypothetical protein
MKNLAGKERWIIIKEMPRRQEFNPKFAAVKVTEPGDARGIVEHNIRMARLRSEPMIFTPDEVIIPEGDSSNFLFSADNLGKFCCMRNELPYLIEQGFITALPYTREMIDNLKANWARDPIFDLYEFPGADEYWDELKAYQNEEQIKWRDSNAKIKSIAANIASLPLLNNNDFNYELLIIAMISAREADPKICIAQANALIFEMAREQYSLQTTKDKKNDNKQRRKLGPKKQLGATEQPATTDS